MVLTREVKSHFGATLIWLVIISFLRFNIHESLGVQFLNLLFLWLGAALGVMLPDLDQVLYSLVIYPQEFNSLRAQRLWEQKEYKSFLLFLAETAGERTHLNFHNVLFQAVLILFCFFVLSSTVGLFGKGLVMAMFLHLLKDEISLMNQKRDEFLRQILFWPIKSPVSLLFQRYFVIINLFLFIGFSFLLI